MTLEEVVNPAVEEEYDEVEGEIEDVAADNQDASAATKKKKKKKKKKKSTAVAGSIEPAPSPQYPLILVNTDNYPAKQTFPPSIPVREQFDIFPTGQILEYPSEK